MKIKDILRLLNDGDLDPDIVKMFGGLDVIFKLLQRRNLLNNLKIGTRDSTLWENDYLLFLLKNDIEQFKKISTSLSNDLIYQDGVIYYESENFDGLSILFGSSELTVLDILNGEYEYSFYFDVDFESDIINNLNESNQKILKNLVIDDLKNIEIYPETETLEEIQSELGTIKINMENIDSIFSDNSTIDYIFNEIPDLKSELERIFFQAYERAYIDGLNHQIWEKLSKYFVHESIEWFSTDHPYKKDVSIQKFKMKVWNFDSNMERFLSNSSGESYYCLSNLGSYIEVLKYLIENIPGYKFLNLRWDDWPDHKLLEENFNEIFSETF